MVGIGWGFQPTTNKWERRIMFDTVKFGQFVLGSIDNYKITKIVRTL